MIEENALKLWKIIQEAGDYLKGQLPDHPNHPKGRNPYAHIAICVKSKFQCIFFNHFLSLVDKSAPVVGSSSIPSGVIFLGNGVNVDSGLSS